VDAEIEIRMKGFMRVAEPLLRPFVRREYERKRAPTLKAALESS
jgi:hypothetical protein